MFRAFCNDRNWSGIRAIGQLDPFSLRTKYHFRCQHTVSIHDDFSFLQTAPEFLWNLLSTGTLHVKSALTFDFQGIAVAGYIVIYTKGMDTISIHLKILLFFCYFMIFNRKRQFRRNGAQGIYHTLQSFRTDHVHRFCAVCVPKGQQKSRKTADMVCMIVRKTDHVQIMHAPSLFPDSNLCALSAVNEQITSVISCHQRS